MERIISLACALLLVIYMPKHRTRQTADQSTQTTLQNERWTLPIEKFGLSVERIGNLSAEMYKELAKSESMLYVLNEPSHLVELASMWIELHKHELEIEDAKASLRKQMVLIGQSAELLNDKKKNGFISSSFDIPVGGMIVEVDRYDKGHVFEEERGKFYEYIKDHGLDITSFTVPSLYLVLKAARRGSRDALAIVNDLIQSKIAELETIEGIRVKEEPKKGLKSAIRE